MNGDNELRGCLFFLGAMYECVPSVTHRRHHCIEIFYNSTAAGCKATSHCIQTKWEKMEVEEDHDSVCDICKDMVKQARDQLESNQTQEDLKAVFEGSCALIHIKVIVNECDRLVDQFIPELVETLASQMDPSVVCSVSGLCNSKHIDELLLDYHQKMSEV